MTATASASTALNLFGMPVVAHHPHTVDTIGQWLSITASGCAAGCPEDGNMALPFDIIFQIYDDRLEIKFSRVLEHDAELPWFFNPLLGNRPQFSIPTVVVSRKLIADIWKNGKRFNISTQSNTNGVFIYMQGDASPDAHDRDYPVLHINVTTLALLEGLDTVNLDGTCELRGARVGNSRIGDDLLPAFLTYGLEDGHGLFVNRPLMPQNFQSRSHDIAYDTFIKGRGRLREGLAVEKLRAGLKLPPAGEKYTAQDLQALVAVGSAFNFIFGPPDLSSDLPRDLNL